MLLLELNTSMPLIPLIKMPHFYLSITNIDTRETNKFPFTLKNNSFEISLSNLKPGDYDFIVNVHE